MRTVFSSSLEEKLQQFCFPAGTEVATAEGQKPIEQIQEGDLVWAQSDRTGEVCLKPLKQIFVNIALALVVLHCGTNTLEATSEHPLWVADQGWKAAGQVQIGDELWTKSSQRIAVTELTLKQGQFTVYNFEVEDAHSYFAGRNTVLVHNACQLPKFVLSADKAILQSTAGKDTVCLGILTKEGQIKFFKIGEKGINGHADLVRLGLATPRETLGFSAFIDEAGKGRVLGISELNVHVDSDGVLPPAVKRAIEEILNR